MRLNFEHLNVLRSLFHCPVETVKTSSKVSTMNLGPPMETPSPASRPLPPPNTLSTSGVNRRTAVLFGNKTRKSEKYRIFEAPSGSAVTAVEKSEQKVRRKPGRPPKIAKFPPESTPTPTQQETLESREEPSVSASEGGGMPSLERCVEPIIPPVQADITRVASAVNKDRAEKNSSKYRREGAARETGGGSGVTAWHTVRGEGPATNAVPPVTAGGTASVYRKQSSGGAALSSFPTSTSTHRKESFTKYRNMSISEVDSDVNSGDDTKAGKSSLRSSSGSEDDDDDNDEDGSSSSSRGSSSSEEEDDHHKKSPAKGCYNYYNIIILLFPKCKPISI